LSYVATHTDLRIIAITDHNTLAGALEARRLAPHYGIEVIVGCEISTQIGHVLALFIEQPIPTGLSLAETVARVHEQNGMVFAAHPFGALVSSIGRRNLLGPERNDIDWNILDGIEVFNAYVRSAQLASVVVEIGISSTGLRSLTPVSGIRLTISVLSRKLRSVV